MSLSCKIQVVFLLGSGAVIPKEMLWEDMIVSSKDSIVEELLIIVIITTVVNAYSKSKVKWKSLSCVWLFATRWTIQSMEFSRPRGLTKCQSLQTCINLLTVHMECMCSLEGLMQRKHVAMCSQYRVRQLLKSMGTRAVSYRNSLHQDIIQPV